MPLPGKRLVYISDGSQRETKGLWLGWLEPQSGTIVAQRRNSEQVPGYANSEIKKSLWTIQLNVGINYTPITHSFSQIILFALMLEVVYRYCCKFAMITNVDPKYTQSARQLVLLLSLMIQVVLIVR